MAPAGLLSLALFCAVAAVAAVAADHEPARYTVDLGVDPEHRWDHVVAAQKNVTIQALDAIFSDPKIKDLIPLAKRLIGNALESQLLLPGDQYLEAKGIARGLGKEMSEIVLVGAFYDMFAAANSPLMFRACTGVVAQSSAGEIFHGRNLDYDFEDALAEVALVIDFARDGKTLFTGVTFGPNPTFNTAVRWGSFSVTQNERDRGSILDNFWDMLVLGRPALFARVREAVETVPTFEDAVDFFSDVKLSAAAYFIIGGTKPGEGAVVTRDRDRAVDVFRLNPPAGAWYVLETNYDRTDAPPSGDDRRHPLQRAMNATGADRISAASLWDVISTTHVNTSAGERAPLNGDTIYSTVMQASDPSTFKTLVRISPPKLDLERQSEDLLVV